MAFPISFGLTSLEETREMNKDLFYHLLETTGHFPKTAQPAPMVLETLFQEAKDKGDEMICIFLSSSLSGFYESALMAKQKVGYDKCYIIDSQTASAGERLLAEYAVKLRDQGESAHDIVEAVKALRKRVMIYACMDTLEYLYKGGRLSLPSLLLGSLLSIKPVVHMNKGVVTILAKVRGMKNGIRHIVERVSQNPPDPKFTFYTLYTNTTKNSRRLLDSLVTAGHPATLKYFKNVGAAIGTHVGPNACGVAYIAREA